MVHNYFISFPFCWYREKLFINLDKIIINKLSLKIKNNKNKNLAELLTELARRERDAGIFPDAEIDLYMKVNN